MLEQVGKSIKFIAFFSIDGLGAPGLAVLVNIYNPSSQKVIVNQSATELGEGFYSFILEPSYTSEAGEYVALFRTSHPDVGQKEVPSLWVLGRGGVENLDASISSRMGAGGNPDEDEDPGAPAIVSWTYTLTYPDGVTPITSANVWVSKDSQGTQILAQGLTNQYGRIAFSLPTGDVYIWRKKVGFKFDNPDKEVIA